MSFYGISILEGTNPCLGWSSCPNWEVGIGDNRKNLVRKLNHLPKMLEPVES